MLLSEKRRKTLLQRLGLVPISGNLNKIGGFPIWIHALSVGEVLSALPLAERLGNRFGFKNIVFSASTRTGFEIASQHLNGKVNTVFFFPYDLLFSVKRIANQITPCLAVIVETDIWPNFLFEMKKRNIPVLLVNARLSEKSFAGYRRFSFFTKALFLNFSKICAQTEEDARRFNLLGAPRETISLTGNMKFDQADATISHEEIAQLRQLLKIPTGRKIIVAGSTHRGEEEILADAFSRLKQDYGDLVLIVVPRDPNRAESVSRIFKFRGFSALTMSALKESAADAGSEVIVIDVIGLLRKLYSLADCAFVGGSLVNFRGHNPLEPAVFAKPVLFGPYMADFKQIANMLLESGGAVQVSDAEHFCKAVIMFLTDETKAEEIGKRAFEIFYANKGAVGKTAAEIEKIFSRP